MCGGWVGFGLVGFTWYLRDCGACVFEGGCVMVFFWLVVLCMCLVVAMVVVVSGGFYDWCDCGCLLVLLHCDRFGDACVLCLNCYAVYGGISCASLWLFLV